MSTSIQEDNKIEPRHSEEEIRAEKRRLAAIAKRERKSVFWRVINIFGSLKLAVFLLFSIGVAVAIATFIESRFDTEVARYYIYRHTWFKFWLFLLVVNLAAAAATRWPWRKRHTGFVLTHAGIIILILGGLIDSIWGIEAGITLQKDQPPRKVLFKNDTVVRMAPAKSGGDVFEYPIELTVQPPTNTSPEILPVPETNLRLIVDAFSDALRTETTLVASPTPAPPAVQLTLASSSLGQSVPVNLILDQRQSQSDFFGMAQIVFATRLPPLTPANTGAPLIQPAREIQVVLATSPDTPIQSTTASHTSGIAARLISNPQSEQLVLEMTLPGEEQVRDENRFQLAGNVGMAKPVAGLDNVMLTIRNYWPHFAMRENRPTSLSDEPVNPAVMLEFTLPVGFQPKGINAIENQKRQLQATGKGSTPVLIVSPPAKEGDRIPFYIGSGAREVARGELEAGEPIGLGWNDWTVTLERYLPQGRLEARVIEPGEQSEANESKLSTRAVVSTNDLQRAGPPGQMGIRARLRGPNGEESEPRWLLGGRVYGLGLGDQFVSVALSRAVVEIPFSIQLLNFEVPRDPGTDTPAGFIATLKFTDLKTDTTHVDKAYMNYPALFPGQWWKSVFGWNWKFSQAGWNKENLNESTLQALYDPGWPLKWFGCLVMSIGIAILFYWKPTSRPKLDN